VNTITVTNTTPFNSNPQNPNLCNLPWSPAFEPSYYTSSGFIYWLTTLLA
jgi:hypothetical protein